MLQYAILWLLRERRDYGYHLKRRFEERMGGMWPLNVGQIYQTLQKLEQEGLIEAVEGDGDDADGHDPSGRRRLIAPTAKGLEALDRWLRRRPGRPRPMRDETLIRLLMLDDGRPDAVLSSLGEQETLCHKYLSRLRAQRRTLAGATGVQVGELGREAEIYYLEAHLRWLEYCRRRVQSTTRPVAIEATAAAHA